MEEALSHTSIKMKHEHKELFEIPEGTTANVKGRMLEFQKGGKIAVRRMDVPDSSINVEGNKVIIHTAKANKNHIKIAKATVAHMKNMVRGLDKEFSYRLEVCVVHFPMTVKVEGRSLVITNFLGEKRNRTANLLEGVKVEVKGQEITVTGHDKEAVGQTVANIEKATLIKKRDRRVFQDGIFVTHKDGKAI